MCAGLLRTLASGASVGENRRKQNGPGYTDTRPVGSFAAPDGKGGLEYLGGMLYRGYICCLVKPRMRRSCFALGLVLAGDMTPELEFDELLHPFGTTRGAGREAGQRAGRRGGEVASEAMPGSGTKVAHNHAPARAYPSGRTLLCAVARPARGRYVVGTRVVGDEVTLPGGGKTWRASKSKLDWGSLDGRPLLPALTGKPGPGLRLGERSKEEA